jgi:hypothetical protein
MSIEVLSKFEFFIVPKLKQMAEEGLIRRDYKEVGDEILLNNIIEEVENAARRELVAKRQPDGSMQVFDRITGVGAERWLENHIDKRPHYKPTPIDDTMEAAFGAAPTMKARADALAALGPEEYYKTMEAWGGSPFNLKPGVAPKGDDRRTKKPGSAEQARNAYLLDEKDPQREKRIISLVSTLPPKVVADLARAAGCSVSGKRLQQTLNSK